MILVDTSIWVEHLRKAHGHLIELLEAGDVLIHPMIIAELACGTIPKREEVLSLLKELPCAPTATDQEAMLFIEEHRLMGRGIGYIDVHLLASTVLAADTRLWTADSRLATSASRLFVSYAPER